MKPHVTIYTKEHGKIELNTYEEWIVVDDSNITYHREDGPAIEWANGTKQYWLNGELHREDGPAAEWANGTKEHYRNGQLHREDGPAVEYADGDKEYWLNGESISKKEFNKIIRNKSILQTLRRFVYMTADTLIYLANQLKHLT